MIWWITATLAAFFIKGLCGFANTLVFTTILSFGNDNVNISPIELILGYPANVIMAWKERKSIKPGICVPLSAMVIIGGIPGALFLKNADTGIIKLVFGFIIILIALELLVRELKPVKLKPSRALFVIVGILSGVLCGLFGIGALIGAYVGRITEDTRAFKANISIVFFVENTFRIIIYSIWDIINIDVLERSLTLMPLMLIGLAGGIICGRVINDRLAKHIVIIMLIVSGAALVINNI